MGMRAITSGKEHVGRCHTRCPTCNTMKKDSNVIQWVDHKRYTCSRRLTHPLMFSLWDNRQTRRVSTEG